jgi:hypothetical protein
MCLPPRCATIDVYLCLPLRISILKNKRSRGHRTASVADHRVHAHAHRRERLLLAPLAYLQCRNRA